jgi:uncharacterized protein (DUF2141 family)
MKFSSVKRLLSILSAIGLLMLLPRCAQVVPLTGGQKDVTPPKLEASEPLNNSTHFSGKQIVLHFDEYVQLRDLPNQLLISPKIKTPPEITAVGKKVVISLDPKELAPHTTYRFSFGKAIADMNESNAIDNFDYVFTTGDHIDTLKLSGTVTDAFSTNPISDVIVGLYRLDQKNDSTPYIYTPDYLTRTKDGGQFQFRNLPPQKFSVFAITDKNKNLLYDGDAEKIAFYDSELDLNRDSSIRLSLFQEEPSRIFIKRTISTIYGLSQIILNKKSLVRLQPLRARQFADILEENKGALKDTVNVFYRNINDTLGLLFETHNSKNADTLQIVLPKTPAKKVLDRFTVSIPQNVPSVSDKITISFLTWMDTSHVNRNRLKLLSKADSAVSAQVLKGRWRNFHEYEIEVKLKEVTDYTLKIDTNAFQSVHGNTNDTSNVTFKTKSKVEFGKVTLKLKLNKKQSYIIQLLNDQMKIIQEQAIAFSLSSSNAATLDFIEVPPGTYQVKIIFDDNNNQKWDGGVLMSRQQPEKVIINSKQLKVLADWEIEEEIIEKGEK